MRNLCQGPRSYQNSPDSSAAGQSESVRNEAGRIGAGRIEAGQIEAGQIVAGQIEAGQSEADQSEAGRDNADRNQPGKAYESNGGQFLAIEEDTQRYCLAGIVGVSQTGP